MAFTPITEGAFCDRRKGFCACVEDGQKGDVMAEEPIERLLAQLAVGSRDFVVTIQPKGGGEAIRFEPRIKSLEWSGGEGGGGGLEITFSCSNANIFAMTPAAPRDFSEGYVAVLTADGEVIAKKPARYSVSARDKQIRVGLLDRAEFNDLPMPAGFWAILSASGDTLVRTEINASYGDSVLVEP